ncbi:MAG TPA: ABC transporter ATP-binding protein [Bacteroidales bacterium]|nr:ABC transporter ATP-binding protein [Bacteroidales bacterium]HOK75799.1 ABC transporter ATP-binding protein [Bacteroidales bacterium]HOM41810.1 ABC transporter ATP-binding protein [Bacteroidales bacterium]HPP93088.1 ABC transporter ATP-binding protein [Bacteroidales bacterium]HQK70571.1 ABC transporter ATP-binding protein [Bacteroidales bacterium]
MAKVTAENVIEVRDVWKSFKSVQAVRGVSMSVPRGKFIALVGPNGAGKTTLVEMIENIRRPDNGEIRILGKKWKGNEEELRRTIGISLQQTYFIDKLTVYETLRLFASFFDLDRERVEEIINLTGLDEKRKSYVINLSGGQRQRLALGIALINHPAILLLDEPTTGLDPNARYEIWNILKSYRKTSEASMILTTHYMEEAETLCDYIILMDQGKILREGTLQQLLEDDKGEKVIEFTVENSLIPPDIDKPGLPFKITRDQEGQKAWVTIKDFDEQMPLFLTYIKSEGLSIKHLECRKKTLDDLFISLTGRRIDG